MIQAARAGDVAALTALLGRGARLEAKDTRAPASPPSRCARRSTRTTCASARKVASPDGQARNIVLVCGLGVVASTDGSCLPVYVCIGRDGYQCVDGLRGGRTPDYDELVLNEGSQLLPAYRLFFRV